MTSISRFVPTRITTMTRKIQWPSKKNKTSLGFQECFSLTIHVAPFLLNILILWGFLRLWKYIMSISIPCFPIQTHLYQSQVLTTHPFPKFLIYVFYSSYCCLMNIGVMYTDTWTTYRRVICPQISLYLPNYHQWSKFLRCSGAMWATPCMFTVLYIFQHIFH